MARAGWWFHSLSCIAALAALLVWGGTEVQSPWGETAGAAFPQAQINESGSEFVTEQVAALGCSITPGLTAKVAVKPAGKTADGVFDSGVVSIVSTDEGWALATAGTVFVVGFC